MHFAVIIAGIVLAICIACEKHESNSFKDKKWTEYSDYIPFPEKDAIWINKFTSENFHGSDESPTYSIITTNQYFFRGDTLIGDIKFRKLYNNRIAEKFTYETDSAVIILDTTDIYSGAMRQDIPNKKVYFVFNSEVEEKLLYDFDLKLGDSIIIYTTLEKTGTVSCIDSILYYDRYHKYYHINVGGLGNAICIVEGIGNSDGLILEKDIYMGSSFDFELVSFSYGSEKINVSWDTFPYKCN